MNASIEDQVERIMYGAEFGDDEFCSAMSNALRERMLEAKEQQRPLRVYAGYDPSAPDLHLGHSITLRKLRQFQDLGHHVIFLVGTFTAQIGDTSDKLSSRPMKTKEQTEEAAKSYAQQCFLILDKNRTEVVYNGDWLSALTLSNVIALSSHFTVQQFLVRENYKRRIERGDPVGLHEFMYALLQGYDAVHLKADVQLGATEQLFNIRAGAKLQQALGQKPCVCITFPILVGTDGKSRMSKSQGNYVGLGEPPDQQFGKIMSISDDTMLEWSKYVTTWLPQEIDQFCRDVREQCLHPMEAKKRLASHIVSMYHGERAAANAKQAFENVHQKRQMPENLREVVISQPINIVELLVDFALASSKSAARRLIDGGGVRIDSAPVKTYEQMIEGNVVIQVGKRNFLQITYCNSGICSSTSS